MSSSWPKVSVVKDMDQCLLETPLGSILSIQCSILCSLHLSTPYLRLFVRSVGILRWKNFGVFLCAGRHCFAGRQNATAALPCHNFIKCCLPNPAPILNQVIQPIWKGGLKGSWPYIELLSNYPTPRNALFVRSSVRPFFYPHLTQTHTNLMCERAR